MNEFILQNSDRIICEPSGLTYTDLKYQLTQKIMILNIFSGNPIAVGISFQKYSMAQLFGKEPVKIIFQINTGIKSKKQLSKQFRIFNKSIIVSLIDSRFYKSGFDDFRERCGKAPDQLIINFRLLLSLENGRLLASCEHTILAKTHSQ